MGKREAWKKATKHNRYYELKRKHVYVGLLVNYARRHMKAFPSKLSVAIFLLHGEDPWGCNTPFPPDYTPL